MKTLFPIGLALLCASAQLNHSATVGNFVWNDLNRNGIQDTNEPGLDGVTVRLFDCTNTNLLATLVTTNNGAFSFSGRPTQVFLSITVPDGYSVTAANAGTNDLVDSDIDPATLRTPCITLDCAEAESTNCVQEFWDIGLTRNCSDTLAGPGFWKTHPQAWPVTNITIAGSNYNSSDAWELMANGRDKSLTVFRALLTARLNILAGNESSCITQAVAQAEEWLTENPRGSDVRGPSDAWKEGARIVEQLNAYNDGALCAKRCDNDEPDVEVRPRNKNQEEKLRLRIVTKPGQIFTVQQSSNLSNWVDIATVTNQFGIREFLSDFTPQTNQFYRIVVLAQQAGTDEPVNAFGTFKEVGNDERAELQPIVYDGDLIVRGNSNEVRGAGIGETVIAGNIIITGSNNTVRDLTVLGQIILHGNNNKVEDVEGAVSDLGLDNEF